MTLITDGSVSKYSAQALALLFFPGSGFPEDGSGGEPVVELSVSRDGETAVGHARITKDGNTVEKTYAPSAETAARSGEKRLCNLACGGALYLAGCEVCGTVPPWGILTGVRPARICRDMLSAGKSGSEVEEILVKDYFCSAEKARIAVGTALRELRLTTDGDRRRCSVYVAIPFCPSKCSYCSFTSFASPRLLSLIPDYADRLCTDIENTFAIIKRLGLEVSTLYIGGGTPTVLDEKQLFCVLKKLSECTDISALREFTLEAGRPDTINTEKLRIARDFGVTRVSVNAQTMNAEVLSAIGRRHTPEDFLRAYGATRDSGIRDINVDLIAGLPGESGDSFLSSLETVIGLDPTNITVHTFYAKRAAQIVKTDGDLVFRPQDRGTAAALDAAGKMLDRAHYAPYYLYRQKNTAANLENAGYAKDGHECLYNIFMMEELHTVFGIGASAMTKLVSPDDKTVKIKRVCETKYPYEYLDPTKNSAEKRYKELLEECIRFYEGEPQNVGSSEQDGTEGGFAAL